jgi:hypothetical protein
LSFDDHFLLCIICISVKKFYHTLNHSLTGSSISQSGGVITHSYFLDTSGPDNGLGTPLDDPNMKKQASFIGWDFVGETANGTGDIWWILENITYPKLNWQRNIPPCPCCPNNPGSPGNPDDGGIYFPDYNFDFFVNFEDFAIFANEWLTENPFISLDTDNDVDINDLKIFCNYWLEGTVPSIMVYEYEPNEPNEPPAVWLVYDGNMIPDYNDEITVYIHSDPMLFAMGVIIEVSGDANITTAMSESDCNNYGWDNGWNSDPIIDPNGWVYIWGISWEGTASGTVGYFKFRYYSGEVVVSITPDSGISDANCMPVVFSQEPLIFGIDPNE